MKVNPKNILFIKLGREGTFEKECIEKNNTLKLSFVKTDHQQCINKDWDLVKSDFIEKQVRTISVATNFTNQIKKFYEEDENTLWITFYKNKLWWCFSEPKITLNSDGTKTRPVIGKWSDKNILNQTLLNGNISGKLLKTQGFRGTICEVSAKEYALQKINAEQLPIVAEVENAMSALESKVSNLIQGLQWQDFELLIDLIFRQMGWQRSGVTGKTTKDIDLELFSPVTSERALVQIKTSTNLIEYKKYEEKFISMSNDYDKFFFIAHTDKNDEVRNYVETSENQINTYLIDKVTELTISSGLLRWVIERFSKLS